MMVRLGKMEEDYDRPFYASAFALLCEVFFNVGQAEHNESIIKSNSVLCVGWDILNCCDPR